jgi:hypothetical protein
MALDILLSVVVAAVLIAAVAVLWRALERAGQPGWGVLVPIYGLWVLVRGAKRPAWWFGLTLVPILNVAVVAWLVVDLLRGARP